MRTMQAKKMKEQDRREVVRAVEPLPSLTPVIGTNATILALHHFIGNRAVGEMFHSGLLGGSGIQTKLEINQQHDPAEQEADQVANNLGAVPSPPCSCGGTCEKCKSNSPRLQRLAIGGKPIGKVPPIVQDVLQSGTGRSLDHATQSMMEPHLGHDFGLVRVFDDARAAESASAIGAKAYTVGKNIVFGAGQYSPQTSAGKRLLAHELTHVVQQAGGGGARGQGLQKKDAPKAPALTVSRVTLSCADKTIVFETPGKSYAYSLTSCDLTEGIYNAKVSVKDSKVVFDLGNQAQKGTRFHFGFDIQPGQINPAKLFKGQPTVTIEATNKSLAPKQETFSAVEGLTSESRITPYEQFKRLVRNAGKVRMAQNRAALEQWKQFIQRKLSAAELGRQAYAEDARRLEQVAEEKGTVPYFEEYAGTRGPALREYQRGLITKERCPSCHAVLRAYEADRRDNPFPELAPERQTLVERLSSIAATEQETPSPRPDFLRESTETPPSTGTRPSLAAFPRTRAVTSTLETIKPFLRPLGEEGYQILPRNVLESKASPAELRAQILDLISKRQGDYLAFSRKIDDPDFDYLELRPIVRDLLILESPEVRARVQQDIDSAEDWEIIKAIAVGAATIGLLVLAIFPPTSALGIAGTLTLEAGVGTYGVYSGLKAIEQGELYSLARGASDVLDPEQQEAATLLRVAGILNVVLSGLSLGGTALRSVQLIRTVKAGTSAGGTIGGVEAEAGGNKIVIKDLDTANPQIEVTDPQGKVLSEGPVASAGETTAADKPPVSSTQPPESPAADKPPTPAKDVKTQASGKGTRPPRRTAAASEAEQAARLDRLLKKAEEHGIEIDREKLNQFLRRAKTPAQREKLLLKLEDRLGKNIEGDESALAGQIKRDFESVGEPELGEGGLPEGADKADTTTRPRTSRTRPSTALGEAYERETGQAIPEAHDRHHIVASKGGGEAGDRARAVMDRAGIGLNEGDNGIPLPARAGGDVPPEALTPHANIHTKLYYETVAARLEAVADDPAAVRAALGKIRDEIREGIFPY